MQRHNGNVLFAAHDLERFLGCSHATFLEIRNLEEPLPKAEDDAQLKLLREKGLEHELGWLEKQKAKGLSVTEIAENGSIEDRVGWTLEVIGKGAAIIYQAALLYGSWHGYADFLRRIDSTGESHPVYEVLDTKLSHTATPSHVIQLCVYSELLAEAQGHAPASMYVILGDDREAAFRFEDFAHYFRVARQRFEAFVANPPGNSYPEPCRACDQCRWRELCAEQWEKDNHLSLVANIQRSQIRRLNAAGVNTVRELAELPEDREIPKLSGETFARLRSQARLQVHKLDTGENKWELLPVKEGRGYNRLPEPDEGDLFLDFEGDPLFPDGLEYLMGLYFVEAGSPVFMTFWGHDHDEERRAFESLMDFFKDHLRRYPKVHIYHYNHYEETAIKRLASAYGTREDFVDDLLRGRKLVDLYKIVREAIRVSEPRYSIKNLEAFYMESRRGEVKTAGDSIVVYERWRQTRDEALLRDIAEYNEADCRSTLLLRDWLLTLRPTDLPWPDLTGKEQKSEAREEVEERLEGYARSLRQGVSEEEMRVRDLTVQLLGFHRREEKPQWWAMFDRQGRTDEELIEDAECLGGLRQDRSSPLFSEKKSMVFTYAFPPQDYKFQIGDE
ncbi:MAG: TM0106 family RecB-like putative nuclease, partial [Syntrophaceae bacterium]|nr:TM0106 family RecB-like putative nuclease [Syntrophaceae bacterium]